MLHIIICTEGEVSEPTYIEALKTTIISQAPFAQSVDVEVMSVPLKGNQGHKKIIEKAEEKIKECETDPDSLLCLDEEPQTEKWLICDYDKMNQNGVDLNLLRKEAESKGYKLVINKPSFEFFVLLHFLPISKAIKIKIDDYAKTINEAVIVLNQQNIKDKGFTEIMNVPIYSHPKKKYAAQNFFGTLLNNNPELIDMVIENCGDNACNKFSEMPLLIERMREIFG